MANVNQQFLEEYKYLDKVCKEIFNSDKGITNYIDYMKSVPYEQSRNIADWESDLKMLISLRHIRNQLTHDVGTLSEQLCDKKDIAWLENFHSRIISSKDPISLLRKSKSRKSSYSRQSTNPSSNNTIGCIGAIAFSLGCIILFIVAFFMGRS